MVVFVIRNIFKLFCYNTTYSLGVACSISVCFTDKAKPNLPGGAEGLLDFITQLHNKGRKEVCLILHDYSRYISEDISTIFSVSLEPTKNCLNSISHETDTTVRDTEIRSGAEILRRKALFGI